MPELLNWYILKPEDFSTYPTKNGLFISIAFIIKKKLVYKQKPLPSPKRDGRGFCRHL